MSDLRARIADALCAFLADYNNTGVVHLTEGVDRLLALPGVAVVELPGPTDVVFKRWISFPVDGQKVNYAGACVSPEDVRELAAALLAAAAAAEATA